MAQQCDFFLAERMGWKYLDEVVDVEDDDVVNGSITELIRLEEPPVILHPRVAVLPIDLEVPLDDVAGCVNLPVGIGNDTTTTEVCKL